MEICSPYLSPHVCLSSEHAYSLMKEPRREFLPFRSKLSLSLCSESALPAYSSMRPLGATLSVSGLLSSLSCIVLPPSHPCYLLFPTNLIVGKSSKATMLRVRRMLGTSCGGLTWEFVFFLFLTIVA